MRKVHKKVIKRFCKNPPPSHRTEENENAFRYFFQNKERIHLLMINYQHTAMWLKDWRKEWHFFLAKYQLFKEIAKKVEILQTSKRLIESHKTTEVLNT